MRAFHSGMAGLLLWSLWVPLIVRAQAIPAGLTAEQIMARVAANQDRAEAERAHFVYVQHTAVQSLKGRTVMCKEVTETRVTPLPKGETRSLLSLRGEVRDGPRIVRYNTLPTRAKGSSTPGGGEGSGREVEVEIGEKQMVQDLDSGKAVPVSDTDIDLAESMREHLTSAQDSKDGLNSDLFPLTSAQQKTMTFDLKGREPKNGQTTYHVVFFPRDKSDMGWKGDAWVDAATFQPVVIRTALSRRLPLGVRALLGTDLPGLGFTAVYAPQEGGLWFPSSFGTEFKIRVLFFFHRHIVVSVQNHDFERTHVLSTIHTEAAAPVDGSAPDRSGKR